MDISIIVPVYNAEKTLDRCVKSIQSQTYVNFELILINDGSTDKSGEMCDNYATADHRIKVVHKNNEGVSSARQLGVEISKGIYSIHVDSDDYVELNYLELLYNKAIDDGADIVICDYFHDRGTSSVVKSQQAETKNSDIYLEGILNGKYMGYVWNKLIRHSLYSKYNSFYPKEIFYGEDVCVLSSIMSNSLRVSYIDKPLYHHIDNPLSITKQINKDKVYSRIKFIEFTENLLEKRREEKI